MKNLIALFGLLATPALASLAERATCNADNCARAITGIAFGPERVASRRKDCSSFFSETLFPFPVLSTITSGSVAAYTPVQSQIGPAPGITPPPYAVTACKPTGKATLAPDVFTFSVAARFRSVCSSCLGLTRTTVATAPLTTETIIVPTGNPQPKTCGRATTEDEVSDCSLTCPCLGATDGNNYCLLDVSDDGPSCSTQADCPQGTRCVDRVYGESGSGRVCGTVAGYQACVNPAPLANAKLRMARGVDVSIRRVDHRIAF